MVWRGTPFFELNAESKETKLREKRWYVAYALCITLIFFSLKKLRGPEWGPEWGLEGDPERGPEGGVQVLSTPNCD